MKIGDLVRKKDQEIEALYHWGIGIVISTYKYYKSNGHSHSIYWFERKRISHHEIHNRLELVKKK